MIADSSVQPNIWSVFRLHFVKIPFSESTIASFAESKMRRYRASLSPDLLFVLDDLRVSCDRTRSFAAGFGIRCPYLILAALQFIICQLHFPFRQFPRRIIDEGLEIAMASPRGLRRWRI